MGNPAEVPNGIPLDATVDDGKVERSVNEIERPFRWVPIRSLAAHHRPRSDTRSAASVLSSGRRRGTRSTLRQDERAELGPYLGIPLSTTR